MKETLIDLNVLLGQFGRSDLEGVHCVEAQVEDDGVADLYFGLVTGETHFRINF